MKLINEFYGFHVVEITYYLWKAFFVTQIHGICQTQMEDIIKSDGFIKEVLII